MYLSIKNTANLLSKTPKNAWLRGKLVTESKQYTKMLKMKQKEFINATFKELEQMHSTDPKAYIDLVKALRDGSHDKGKESDTESVEPDVWFEYFNSLLGKSKMPLEDQNELKNVVENNYLTFISDLDEPFTKDELKEVVKNLKNNKSS